ncbi:MAG: hypothetical protein ACI33P_08905 [Lysinibacillus sp.]
MEEEEANYVDMRRRKRRVGQIAFRPVMDYSAVTADKGRDGRRSFRWVLFERLRDLMKEPSDKRGLSDGHGKPFIL